MLQNAQNGKEAADDKEELRTAAFCREKQNKNPNFLVLKKSTHNKSPDSTSQRADYRLSAIGRELR